MSLGWAEISARCCSTGPASRRLNAMTTTSVSKEKSTATDDRIERALTELMAIEQAAPGMFVVRTNSGGEYTADLAEGRCTCPDFENRGEFCKHLFRVAFETGAGIPGQCGACAELDGLPCAGCFISGFQGGR